MIQEEATKIISRTLYSSLASHFFREFTNKLKLEINKEPVTGGMTIPDQKFGPPPGRYGNKAGTQEQSNSQAQISPMGASQQRKQAPISGQKLSGFQDQDQFQRGNNTLPRRITERNSIEESIDLGRDETQFRGQQIAQANRNATLADVTAGQGAAGQSTTMGNLLKRDEYLDQEVGLISNQNISKPLYNQGATTLNQNIFQKQMSNLSDGKQGVVVQGILRLLEKKIQETTVLSSLGKDKPLNLKDKLTAGIQARMKAMRLASGDDPKVLDEIQREEKEHAAGMNFLRVGDVVLLYYDEKVYEDLAGQQDNPDDPDQSAEFAQEKASSGDNLKAKVTQEPDFEYKGIIFSDGVTNQNFKVVSRHLANQDGAMTNFKKTLFRLEIAQECKYNIIKQSKLEELDEKEKERAQYSDDVVFGTKSGGSRRKNKQHDEAVKLDEEIAQIQSELEENEKRLTEEIKNNDYEFNINLGKKITYGQKIQLKHLFSDKYLTLNTKRISHEYGCVNINLSPPNENSWFQIIPSEKIKCMGQSISFQDTFFIRNYSPSASEKPIFYMHINEQNIIKTGVNAPLEVNGSFQPTKLRAKLYMDYTQVKYEKTFFESGDVLRLLHKEADGYLTVYERDVELALPEYPDFLQREVHKLQGMSKGPGGLNMIDDDENGVDLKERQRAIQAQQNEIRRRKQTKVFIERNIKRIQFSNTCWEVQKIQTFHGGPIIYNDLVRLKHIATSKYLSVNPMDKRELLLKDDTDSSDTLFKIRKETYRPPKAKNKKNNEEDEAHETVNPHDQIIIETFHEAYVHLSQTIEEEYSLQRGDADAQGIRTQNNQKNDKKEDVKNKNANEGEGNEQKGKDGKGQETQKINEDEGRIEPIIGYFSRDDKSKMVFILEEVHSLKNQEAKIAYQGSSFYKSLLEFYNFLNKWAVVDVDEDDLEILGFQGVPLDLIDKEKYYFPAARDQEPELMEWTDFLDTCILDQLITMINQSIEEGFDHYQGMQKHLAEQGILVILIKILELIYYKSVSPSQREKDLLGADDREAGQKLGGNDADVIDEETPEFIAREMLDPIAHKIIKVVHSLIKQNRENAERLTKYDNIIYMMITKYDHKLVAKLYKETYKRAQNIHTDHENKDMGVKQGGGPNNVAHSGDQEKSEGSSSSIIMKKWTDRLEAISFINEDNENITRQVLYLNIISMICRDDQGRGLYQFQLEAIRNILDDPKKIPITFGLQRKDIDRPIIFINKKPGESEDMFLQKNPLLRDVWKQHKAITSAGQTDSTSSICVDLYDLTEKNQKSNYQLQPYINYIAAVINLYCHMSLSRNQMAVKKLKEINLTLEHVVAGVTQYSSKGRRGRNRGEKTDPLDKQLIAAYMFAARVMYIDANLFPQLHNYKNRCYFWDTIHEADAHKTMYRWEKPKFFRGFEDNNRMLKEEQDQHETLAMGQLRDSVYNFFSGMPEVLKAFLYSYESRKYAKRDVTPVLTLMYNYIDAATSLIACELVDSKFIYRMLQAASIIFISYHYPEMPHTAEDKSFIYMVLQVAKKTKRCKEKVEILEYKTLKLLETICQFRMSSQILIFLQLFRIFVEKNQLPHVSESSASFDEQFNVIFQLYQFNIGKNLTFKTLERMVQKMVLSGLSAGVAKKVLLGPQPLQRRTLPSYDGGLGVTDNYEDDPNNQLLQIGEIRLTEDPNADGDQDGLDEVDDQGNILRRDGNDRDNDEQDAGEEGDDGNDGDGPALPDGFRRRKQYNDKYELDKFLLYLIFAKSTNQGIRNLAVKVLVNNFNQRELLLNELTKVELIISSLDQDDYKNFMQQHFMLRGLIDRLHQLSIEMKAAGGNGRDRDVKSYRRSIEDISNILKGLTTNLQQHVGIILISVGEDTLIEQESKRLMKKQNMLRHMDISEDLVDKLMNRIITNGTFRKDWHSDMFKEVSRFLFMYSFGNLSNQSTLVKHLNFFVSLTDYDVPTPKLVAQILNKQRESEHGLEFLKFLTEKIANSNGASFKSSLFKLLTLMMTRPITTNQSSEVEQLQSINIETNQVFVLKRLVKKARFRRQLFMDEKHSGEKLEFIADLVRRVKELKSFSQMKREDQVAYTAEEREAFNLHVSIIDLLSCCVRNCLFGRLQARNLISAEVLFDSIMSEAVPLLLRRKYLRLLFEVYFRVIQDDPNRMDYNTQTFHNMMFYIILEDLRQYSRYYIGLMIKVKPEDFRDNETEALRKRTEEALSQRSIEDVRKRNMERTRQEQANFQEERKGLSSLALPQGQQILLIDDTDKYEYWKYLSQFKKSRNEADGLLHFIADFYNNVKKTISKKMSRELLETTSKIREVLMEMSDDLNKINEQYGEYLNNVDHILNVIDQALMSIPNVSIFKAGKKFHVKGGGNGQSEAVVQVLGNNAQQDDQGSEDEEDENNLEVLAQRAREDPNNSRNLDIKMASDKIINIIRDTIVNEGTNVRPLFMVKNFEQNLIMRKLDLKKMIKLIVGSQATNDEIEMFMEFIDTFSREETEQRRTIQPDIANEAHIRIRTDPLKVLQLNNGHSKLTNFRDLENLIRKALQKLQYKPPVQKRGREEMEQQLQLEMAEDQLSRACNTDLKLFTKCFFDFFQKFRKRDEIADIVKKITLMFDEAFDLEESGIRNEESYVMQQFIHNMIQGFSNGKDKIYLLKILNMVIDRYLPSNPENKRFTRIRVKNRLKRIQIIMKDCGLLSLLLKFISQDDLIISDEAIKLLCNLLCESNTEVQEYLLDMMKKNRDNFKFFSFIKERLQSSSDYLIKQMEQKLLQRYLAQESSKFHKDPRMIETLYNVYQQPFYLPQQSSNGQSIFNLETEIKSLTQQQSSGELLNLLRLIQLLCDNCYQGFQDYLRNQEENTFEQMQPLTTVNVVTEVANVLIKLTSNLGHQIFSEYILYETVGQLFDTLIDFLHGPNSQNQLLLGCWKKLSKAVNFYLNQNLGVYASNTTEQKAKLTIMKSCTDFLLALTESVDLKFRKSIMEELTPEIDIENMKYKMVEIFHYKIGSDPKKQRTYYSNKKCDHFKDNTPTVRYNMCEQDEFCEFGNLIKFDKSIIAAGFNIFIFLYNFKEVLPGHIDLQDFDSDFKNERFYQQLRKEFQSQINEFTRITPERHARAIEQNEVELKKAIMEKTEEILIQINIKNPTTKIYTELAKKDQAKGGQGNDEDEGMQNLNNSAQMEIKVFDLDKDDGAKRDQDNENNSLAAIAKRRAQRDRNQDSFCQKVCCRTGQKRNKVLSNQEATSGDHNMLIESVDNIDPQTDSSLQRSNKQYSSHKLAAEAKIKDEIEAEALESYTPWQYMMDSAIRFYVSNVASIEINYNGSLSKVMFRIPPFCTFFTRSSQKKMIYEANHESHIEKLEDFFNKRKTILAEMKAIQRLARRSKVLKWISEKWKPLSYCSLFMILIINLLFIIFYQLDDSENVKMSQRESEIAVELLGIIQAFISFTVMASYILRYHGKIYQMHLEEYQSDSKDRFTNVKGSLGYAYGAEVYKVAHQSQALAQASGGISQSDLQMMKQRTDEYTLEKNRRRINSEDLLYSIKIFIISMKIDTQHAFNVVYFILSVIGVFYHTIFSFLLLDIVIKIPLLQNVVQAIVQNRKQLLYTFILLFTIIYIYSFMAFMNLRESYKNSDSVETGEDAPEQNMYCKTLLECFTSTLNNGLRAGGGIGEVLDQLSLYKEGQNYWKRYVFDLTFFFLVIIILLNLIFGIIIDAFADMRDARNRAETDVKERCFICNLNRFEFETKNKSWFDHTQKEHNAFAYLYFILYVQHKPDDQCTGVEKYVKKLVQQEDPRFFPNGECLAIGQGTSDPEKEKAGAN